MRSIFSSDLNNIKKFNVFNLIEAKGSTSSSGLFTYMGDGIWQIKGTATGLKFKNLVASTASIPSYLKIGKKYYATFHAVNTYCTFQMFSWNESGGSTTVFKIRNADDYEFELPSDTVGVTIRINASYDGTNSNEYDELVYPIISENRFNDSLYDESLIVRDIRDYAVDGNVNLDDVNVTGLYILSTSYTYTSTPTVMGTYLRVENLHNGFIMQICSRNANSNDSPYLYIRRKYIGTWGKWHRILDDTCSIRNFGVSTVACNDITNTAIRFNSYSGGNAMDGYPFNAAGWLISLNMGPASDSPIMLEVAIPYGNNRTSWMFRSKDLYGEWQNWKELSGGSSNQTSNTYNNTYNITTNPTITTDTNGYLQAIDDDSTSESNATDMTGPIMSMLNSTGYCHLGPGIFYVSGNIDMPENSMIEGCGRSTVIRLLYSTTNGYILRPSNRCIIKDLALSGSPVDIDITSGNIGTRNGIHLQGNTDGNGPSVTPASPRSNIVENVYFSNFSGSGIYQSNSGGSVRGAMYVSNCYITQCGVGINIDYYSEYCRYVSVVTNSCYYACINNGGNNIFISCIFHGKVGFVIDNSNNDKSNNAHGSCVGCNFNHIDSNNGVSIKILNSNNGFIFTGCQVWYGSIVIQNSRGIAISDTQLGGGTPSITVTGSYPVFFSNCIFHQQPSLDVTSSTVFNNCYLDSNGSVIGS